MKTPPAHQVVRPLVAATSLLIQSEVNSALVVETPFDSWRLGNSPVVEFRTGGAYNDSEGNWVEGWAFSKLIEPRVSFENLAVGLSHPLHGGVWGPFYDNTIGPGAIFSSSVIIHMEMPVTYAEIRGSSVMYEDWNSVFAPVGSSDPSAYLVTAYIRGQQVASGLVPEGNDPGMFFDPSPRSMDSGTFRVYDPTFEFGDPNASAFDEIRITPVGGGELRVGIGAMSADFVPEPTCDLMVLAAAGLACCRRRRRHDSEPPARSIHVPPSGNPAAANLRFL